MVEYQELAHYHFSNFSQFLGPKSSSAADNFQARNKLAKLTSSQFSELATDVNDEIERRKANIDEYLPIMDKYPPKRNQAREKLSSLNERRFMDLAADVLGELLRRFPECQVGVPAANDIYKPENVGVARASDNVGAARAPDNVGVAHASDTFSAGHDRSFSQGSFADSLDRKKGPPRSVTPIITAPYAVSPISGPSPNVALPKAPNASPKAPNAEPPKTPYVAPPKTPYVAPPKTPPASSNREKTKFHTVTVSKPDKKDDERNKLKEYEQKMSNYQSQITDYELKNLELEAKVYKLSELEKEYTRMNSDLEKLKISEESTKEAHKQMESKYLALEEQYQGLREDYANQEQMTVAIRGEANSLLEEVKNISNEKEKLVILNRELLEKNKNHLQKIQTLELANKKLVENSGDLGTSNDLKISADSLGGLEKESPQKQNEDTKSPESKVSPQKDLSVTEKDSDRLTKDLLQNVTLPLNTASVEQDAKEAEKGAEPRMPCFVNDSLIPRQKTYAYEEALQELFLNAEMGESTGILISMKEIVLSCKSITEEISKLDTESAERTEVIDAKADLSETLTKLMGAAKIHAAKSSPESLQSLYSLGSDLSAVVEKLVNSLTTSSKEKNQDGQGQQDLAYLTEGYDSYYDSAEQNDEKEKLKRFLEEQTDEIVHSIQSLLNSMRQSGPYGDDFMKIVDRIMDAVDLVNEKCRQTMIESINNPQIGEVFEELYGVSRQLEKFGVELVGPGGESNKQLKQKIASSSYEIAKFVKELLTFLE